jgi:hypothetical protein
MTTICLAMVLLFGDLDVVEKREVSLTVLETSTLQVRGIVLLSVTLARGRRWMDWILGALYIVYLLGVGLWIKLGP